MTLEVVSYFSAVNVLGKGEELFKREKKTTGKVVVLTLVLCSATLLSILVPNVQATILPWSWDWADIFWVGEYTSIALDSYDYPHISYRDFSYGLNLKYAWWDGNFWNTETVDSTGDDVGLYTSIALDSSDRPRISYYDNTNHDLKYARYTGATWIVETVDSAGDVGKYSSIALDSNGYPHISYYDDDDDDLKYARWVGKPINDWQITTVDSTGIVGSYYTSIALDSHDRPRISYYDQSNTNLKYAVYRDFPPPEGWSTVTIDSDGSVGMYSSLALDSNDYAHISYRKAQVGGRYEDLKYIRWNGTDWKPEIIPDPYNWKNGQYSSIALDSNDYPHISHYDDTHDDLWYSWWNGTDWTTDYVTEGFPTEGIGMYSSLALDSNDYPHIGCYDSYEFSPPPDPIWGALAYFTTAPPNQPPVADPNGPYYGTEGVPLTFDGSGSYDPDGTIVSYEWDFGDGDTGNGVNPVHTYVQSGTYPVTLTVTDDRRTTGTAATTAYIGNTEPDADFSGTPTSGYEPLTVVFTDLSTSYDGITGWEWDFDNNGVVDSTVQNPTHVYNLEGVYTVTLKVYEGDGDNDVETKIDYIVASDAEPVADFSGTPTSGNPPLTVSFTDLSTSYDGIVSWLWSFGDGETSTEQNPTHIYSDLRNYDVSLTVEEADADSDTQTRADYITVHNFTLENVDSGGDVGMYSSIAVDSNDYPHISYYNSTDGDLKYARWTGSAWVNETVDSSGDVGQFCSLALDIKNSPHICYYDKTGGFLKYAWWDGAGWRFVRVDSAGDVGRYCSLALDSGSFAHISYLGIGLKYAKRTSLGWSVETVDSAAGVGAYTSIALDSSDYPHISYFDKGNFGLKYASWNGSAWNIELVDSDGVGMYTSIALDSLDRPHISYYDFANDDLKYVKRGKLPFTWSIQTVDSEGDVGQFTSLALDSSDKPHVCYYDVTSADLKYARWNGTDWSILRIDSEGNVGMYCSLALDSYNMPHISYYASPDLKYAHLARLPGDADCDWDVDYDDFIILAGAYGSSSGQPAYAPEADFDHDGDVDYDDFIVLAGNYGKDYP